MTVCACVCVCVVGGVLVVREGCMLLLQQAAAAAASLLAPPCAEGVTHVAALRLTGEGGAREGLYWLMVQHWHGLRFNKTNAA